MALVDDDPVSCLQKAEESCVLLLLPVGAAAADVRAVRQGEVHAEGGRLRGAAPRRVHHGAGHGGRHLRLLRGLGVPRPQVPHLARLRLPARRRRLPRVRERWVKLC